MRPDELKRRLRNGVYRGLGEAASVIGAVKGRYERTVCVLRYPKVVSLDDVLADYLEHRPLPPRAVLSTFDDGDRDNPENAVPIRRHGDPAVLFAPVRCLGARRPLPHDERLAARGVVNPTLDWSDLAELERAGACDPIALEDTAAGRHARRWLHAACGS